VSGVFIGWSLDGKQHSFASSVVDRSGDEIHVTNVDGSNQRQLTDDTVGDTEPAWSRK
jgi:Tol biopolymer transport system component